MSDTHKFAQLRDADWLDARSVRFWALMLLLVDLFPIAFRLLTGDGLIDKDGMPFGGDYISFYAASKLALSGHAADAWRPEMHQAAENSVFHRDLGYWAFFYPPAYLLFCLPLALVSYGWSVVLFMAATTSAMLATMRVWLARNLPDIKGLWLPLIAFPGIWMNIACGQNAALTTAIMAGGCLLLSRAPIASGLVFGLLVIKPQLAVALPFLLAAAALFSPQYWKTFVATGVSALMVCAAAWLVVGSDGYAAFFANSALARATLDQDLVESAKMQSLFAALKMFGAPNVLAYAAQGILAVGVLGCACHIVVKHRPDPLALGALLVSATLLISPFLLNYDLLMIALPLGWLILQGVRNGFRPWEKMLCVWLFLLPAVARGLAEIAHLPLGALSVFLLFWLVQGRIAKTADIAMPAVLKSV